MLLQFNMPLAWHIPAGKLSSLSLSVLRFTCVAVSHGWKWQLTWNSYYTSHTLTCTSSFNSHTSFTYPDFTAVHRADLRLLHDWTQLSSKVIWCSDTVISKDDNETAIYLHLTFTQGFNQWRYSINTHWYTLMRWPFQLFWHWIYKA